MLIKEYLTTEYLGKNRDESRFEMIRKAIDYADKIIVANREPQFSNNPAVEVLETIAENPKVLDASQAVVEHLSLEEVLEEASTLSSNSREEESSEVNA